MSRSHLVRPIAGPPRRAAWFLGLEPRVVAIAIGYALCSTFRAPANELQYVSDQRGGEDRRRRQGSVDVGTLHHWHSGDATDGPGRVCEFDPAMNGAWIFDSGPTVTMALPADRRLRRTAVGEARGAALARAGRAAGHADIEGAAPTNVAFEPGGKHRLQGTERGRHAIERCGAGAEAPPLHSG